MTNEDILLLVNIKQGLSNIKKKLLTLLISYPYPISNKFIFEELWGHLDDGGPIQYTGNVGSHICHLRKKLIGSGFVISSDERGYYLLEKVSL